MPPRLFVLLSGSITQEQLARVSPSDILVVGPGIELEPPPGIHVEKVPLASSEGLRLVTDQLAEEVHATSLDDGRDLVQCLLNDIYAYTLRPTYSTIEFLRNLIDERGIVGITILAARRRRGGVPLVGFRTTESRRGSPHLLGAYIAQMIRRGFSGLPVEIVYCRGDFYCIESFRKLFMICANAFFMVIFSLKCLVYLKNGSRSGQMPAHGIIVRVPHQARFAARILAGRKDAAIFAFPQASQGSLRSFGRMVREDLRGFIVGGVRLRGLLSALSTTMHDVRALRRFAKTSHHVELGDPSIALGVDLSDLARELIIFPILIFYKNILAESVVASGCKSLMTFELVGRMAGIESLVARRAGISSTTIQTALVSATPHVVFPWTDLFLTDGPEVADQIRAIGSKSFGSVRYAGSTFCIDTEVKSGDAKKVAYFTQPYEPSVTLDILTVLCENAREQGGHVYLKLHPRDDERTYREIISRYRDVLRPVSGSPALLLGQVDVCVTRTSSVAKEAIAAGIPVVLCLWTRIDKSILADYVRPNSGLRYCSLGPNDLRSTLTDSAELERAACKLRGLLFGGLDVRDLRAKLFHESRMRCTLD